MLNRSPTLQREVRAVSVADRNPELSQGFRIRKESSSFTLIGQKKTSISTLLEVTIK
jgi:hypothetical protein